MDTWQAGGLGGPRRTVSQPMEPPWPSLRATQLRTPARLRKCTRCWHSKLPQEERARQPFERAAGARAGGGAREVGLEHEHAAGVVEAANLADGLDLVLDELVRGTHVARAQRVGGEELRGGAGGGGHMAGGMEVSSVGLRALLLGPPLRARGGDGGGHARELDEHVRGIGALLQQVYGTAASAGRRRAEVEALAAAPADHGGLCRRGARCCSLRWRASPRCAPTFAGRSAPRGHERLHGRPLRAALPVLTPSFLANSCQAPDAYATAAVVLAEMFAGEAIGCWPRRTTTVPEAAEASRRPQRRSSRRPPGRRP